VIEAQLKKSGSEWLVGDKCSYADLSFVPWYWLCPAIMGEGFDKVSSEYG
jgi:glutathione S-transferase